MEKEFGFNHDLAKKVEKKFFKKEGFVGIEDNYADTENRQTLSLEEEREFRELIPRYESYIEELEKLEDLAVEIRNNQNQEFSDLNLELTRLNDQIASFSKLLNEYEFKKEKLNKLNRKNFEFHMNSNQFDLPITDEEKEINVLQQEVNQLSKKIIEEGAEGKIKELQASFEKLLKEIDKKRDLWYPKNPSDN